MYNTQWIVVGAMLIGASLCILGMIFGVLSVLCGLKLRSFLFKNNHSRYCELTGARSVIGDLDGGTINPLKMWEYIKSSTDNENANILRYKSYILKKSNLFCALCLIGFGICMFAMVLVFMEYS